MRVTSVRTLLFTAPWTGDPFWAVGEQFTGDSGTFDRTASLVLVETDEGLTGLGEPIMGYFAPETVPPLVDYYGRLLVDLQLDPTNPDACWRELSQRSLWWSRVGLGLSVLGGVEMALWDIAGKAAGRPVHELIGGPAHDRLPLYASGGTGSWPLQQTVDQARRYSSLGFRGLKIGTGFDGRPGGYTTPPGEPPYGTWYAGSTAERIADERAKFGALREALGPGVELATDAHAVQVREPWTRSSALGPGACARGVRPALLRGAAALRRSRGLRRTAPPDARADRRRRVPDRRRRVQALPRPRRARLRPAGRDARRRDRPDPGDRADGRGAPCRIDRPYGRRGRTRLHGQPARRVRQSECARSSSTPWPRTTSARPC